MKKGVVVTSYLKLFLAAMIWAVLFVVVFWLYKNLGLGEPIQFSWTTVNLAMDGLVCKGLKLFGVTVIQLGCTRI